MWTDVGSAEELHKKKKFVFNNEDLSVLVISHNGNFFAMDNVCVHKKRELYSGMIFKEKFVCPGHQWAYDLTTGWESVKEQGQPIYQCRVVDGTVQVDLSSARMATSA
jgi:nitrite reductase (NADH) small subunit